MLDEVGSTSDQCTFKSVYYWARLLLEAIRATDRVEEILPFSTVLDNKLNTHIWSILVEKLSEHLTLRKIRLMGFACNNVGYHFLKL